MDRPETVKVSGCLLTVTAPKEATPIKCKDNDTRFPDGRSYTSGMLTTKNKVTPSAPTLSIKWFFDGVKTDESNLSTTSWIDQAFLNEFCIRLNMAIGGNWPGSPTAETVVPAAFQVDYVRVYQRSSQQPGYRASALTRQRPLGAEARWHPIRQFVASPGPLRIARRADASGCADPTKAGRRSPTQDAPRSRPV